MEKSIYKDMLETALGQAPENDEINRRLEHDVQYMYDQMSYRGCIAVLDKKADEQEYRNSLGDIYNVTSRLLDCIQKRNARYSTNDDRQKFMAGVLGTINETLHLPAVIYGIDNEEVELEEYMRPMLDNGDTEHWKEEETRIQKLQKDVNKDVQLKYFSSAHTIRLRITETVMHECEYYEIDSKKIIDRTTKWYPYYYPRPETADKTQPKDKLSHKQQILLLHQLGFFDIEAITNLTNEKKGKLVSWILNRTEKDATDYVRNIRGKETSPPTMRTQGNKKSVNDLLVSIGLDKYQLE